MNVSIRIKKALCFLLVLSMMLQYVPMAGFAATGDNLCEHHTEHTAECGYVEGQSECTFRCDAQEPTEEPTEEPAEESVHYCVECGTADAVNEYCDAHAETESETDFHEHTYENGFCTVCGAENPNPYAGKTIACIGDSITYGVGVTKDETDYVMLLAQSLEMEYIRLGASGTTLCTDGHATCNVEKLTEEKLAGADVVTVLMGINDFVQARNGYYKLGSNESTDTSTIYGAVHMWCQRIEELRKKDSLKNTEFYFMTPVITSWNNSVSSVRNWDQSKTNIHDYTLRDLCNAIIEVCKQYDVLVIDLNLISGLYYNSADDNNIEKFGGDGAHPGTVGHQMMADAIKNVLLQNNLRDDHTHNYGSWITTTYPKCEDGEQQQVCTVCTAVKRRNVDGTGHNYESVVTPPTCKEQGYTTYTCATCGDSYKDTYVDALGHSYQGLNCTACGAEHLNAANFEGKTISILGDSISTFTGVSNNTAYNSTLGGGWIYYNEGTLGISRQDTWWQQTIDSLDMELLVNNSWSGSCVFTTRCETVGAYVDRCVQLHDNTGKKPDIIAVYLGTNDFCNFKSTLGTADAINYDTLIVESEDGYTYATPATAAEAYAIMLHKMMKRYPNADIYCFTLLPQRNLSAANQLLLVQFNESIRAISADFDATLVDLYSDSGIKADAQFQSYIADNSLHPGPLGMDAITELFIKELLEQGAPEECTHAYKSEVTAPTCTNKGYTTHTCACGESFVDSYVEATGEHSYDDGVCTVCGVKHEILSLRYDDHYDVSGRIVEILDAGNTIVTLEGDYLVATGIGSARVKIDGADYAITVEKAKVNLVMVVGQSNSGNHFPNATSDVTCPPGTAYHWGYGATEPTDYTQPSMGFHAPLLAELYAQSAAAGDPVKNVLLWEEGYTSKNGMSVTAWAVEKNGVINTEGTDGAAQMVRDCLAYYEQNSDKYEVVHKVVFCSHGCTDHAMETQRYIRLFTAMWERLKAEGMEYVGFLRVRGAHSLYTPENADTYYNAASSAQFEMVRTREDMFMATTLAEAWTGPASTVHSIGIHNYITVMETYGQTADYSDSYGNKASYADGVLTTTMKELYGSNNKIHYGKFGYGLIGADAAYNMYAALNGTRAASITQTDSSGLKTAEHISPMGSTQTLNIEDFPYNLSFYPTCGSPKGTMQITVMAGDMDITENVVSNETATFGTISTEALRGYIKPVIIVSYTYGSKTEAVTYTLEFDHSCNDGHSYESVVIKPTCTEQGYTTHTCACGDSYVDTYVKAEGHAEETILAVAPTCTAAGLTEGKKCSVCGEVLVKQEIVPAKGHTEVVDGAVEATCTATGLTEGKHCTACNAVLVKQEIVPAKGHRWEAADCDNPKTCSVCNATEGRSAGHTYSDGVDGTCNVCRIHREKTEKRTVMHMYRMYNPYSGEHFYTGSTVERENLVNAGWDYEGVGFTFSRTTGAPVYRLYEPIEGEHLYTMDVEEKDMLIAEGWNLEGVAFNSAYDTEVPQYRLHNPYAKCGAYHFTASVEERDFLISVGWEDQGIGFYSAWK